MAQLWVPPIVSSDPLFELQKLASDLQQGRITIEAAYNKMGDISQNLPTSGVAKELWDKFSIIIADAYTTSTKTAKEVGYEITSILTSPEFTSS